MKNGTKLSVIVGIVCACAAVVAAVAAVLMYLDKKRSDRELEHYLDCSIQ